MRLLSCSFLIFALGLSGLKAGDGVPPAERRTVTDVYHGVKVADDYRWLEDGDAKEVKAWDEAQSRHARAYFDALPGRAAVEKQLTQWFAKVSPGYHEVMSRPGRLFALKQQPPKQQPLIVTLASATDLASEKVVVDPNELTPKGQVAIDWIVPSPDGSVVAVCLSENGSEAGALHFYRTDDGTALPDVLPRVQFPTAGGSACWAPDGKTVYYTRYPAPGEKPEADLNFYQQVYAHVPGTPASADVYSIGKEFPRIAEVYVFASAKGGWMVADVANGDGGEHAHYLFNLHEPGGAWRQVTKFEDDVKQVAIDPGEQWLYFRTTQGAPRGKVLRAPLQGKAGLAEAVMVVPEGEAVIEHLVLTIAHLFTSELVGGPSRVRCFDLDGSHAKEVTLPEQSGVGELTGLHQGADDERVLFLRTSFIEPDAWHLYDAKTGQMSKTALVRTSPVDFSDIEAVREFAVSKDGTRVPVSILKRKGTKLDGGNPTLLTGYGGYSISLRPRFDFSHRLWFDHGGVYAVANLRGGGEYGEAWHLAGNLVRKQNVFDDFAACAKHLIERGYTRSDKLAVEGGSNGGLLMGAFLTQHPDLARAVVSHVGLYDMLRVELDPNGAFNVTEFGTVKDLAQFQALHAYSPYHHVVNGTHYPAVLFMAGEHDGRVNPYETRKMAARLQAATASSDRPILARFSLSSGHGIGTALSERIAQDADVFTFLFDQLGAPAR